MATNIISGLLSKAAFSVKKTASGEVAIKGAKISRVSIKFTSNPLRHMKEDGSTVVDSRIIQPATISVDVFAPDIATANQINDLLLDRSNFYSVSSKGVMLNQMMVDSEQARQTPDVMSALPIRITFRQVLSKSAKPVIYAQSSDSSIIDRGLNMVSAASKSVSNLYDSVKGLF